ncbi:hypothetical protein cand_030450 [Cryptosporidium andersoni]|uniref:Uncharacterized protein n=1 Tax=Cryptosporidium andersoni TaxID=117008 RepID=A0A1J4MNP8_9CRYT|nr:hypothetical protein cand_030450 [Cryptosporidium andersoni]
MSALDIFLYKERLRLFNYRFSILLTIELLLLTFVGHLHETNSYETPKSDESENTKFLNFENLWKYNVNDHLELNRGLSASTMIYKKHLNEFQKKELNKYPGINDDPYSDIRIMTNRMTISDNIPKMMIYAKTPLVSVQEARRAYPLMQSSEQMRSEVPRPFPEEQVLNAESGIVLNKVKEIMKVEHSELTKNFISLALDYSFLPSVALKASICMYESTLPYMLVRWKNINNISIKRLDSIIQLVLSIPFYRYYDNEHELVNICSSSLLSIDSNLASEITISNKLYFPFSPNNGRRILGFSNDNFIKKYTNMDNQNFDDQLLNESYDNYPNQKHFNSTGAKRKIDSKSSYKGAQIIHSKICRKFYNCLQYTIPDDIEEYLKDHTIVNSPNENKIIKRFYNIPAQFPNTSVFRTAQNSISSDYFIASLHELIYVNLEMPFLPFPGYNIRYLLRVLYFAGRLGVIIPVGVALKMLYELGNMSQQSILLKRAYCLVSLEKIISYKFAEVICTEAYMPLQEPFQRSLVLGKATDVIHKIGSLSAAPPTRPEALILDLEKSSILEPEKLEFPSFIQFEVPQDRWRLYRAIAIQLYGSFIISDKSAISSVVSVIYASVLSFIRCFWDEFSLLYIESGVLDPELHFSLLENGAKDPGIIELIATSRVYKVPIAIYTKKITPSRKIEFLLEKELTEKVQNLSSIHFQDSLINHDSLFKVPNYGKVLVYRCIRLLVSNPTSESFFEDIFSKNKPKSSKNRKQIDLEASWGWDALIPLFDQRISQQLVNEDRGVKVFYKSVNKEDGIYTLESELSKISTSQKYKNEESPFQKDNFKEDLEIGKILRVSSNFSYIEAFDSTINQNKNLRKPRLTEGINIVPKVYNEFDSINDSNNKYLHGHLFVVVQPIIPYIQVGMYESKIYYDEIYPNNPLLEWETLAERIDLTYLQDVLYEYKTSYNPLPFNLSSWKPPKEYLSTKKSFQEKKVVTSSFKNPNENLVFPLSGFPSSEPEFNFISLKGSPPTPNILYNKKQTDLLNLKILFTLAREVWMLPLGSISKTLYCYSKKVFSYLKNPDPKRIPLMLLYDRLISTVTSLLPTIDNSIKSLRPIPFLLTVCEMTLMDPIELEPFLVILNEELIPIGTGLESPRVLLNMYGKVLQIQKICGSFTKCLKSPNIKYKFKEILQLDSKANRLNPKMPSNQQLFDIQELVPKFPEILPIVKNLFRLIHYLGRRGVELPKSALIQIAKEMAIMMHSVSPFMWRSKNFDSNSKDSMSKKKGDGPRDQLEPDENFPFIPIYDEAYWSKYDKELLLHVCVAIITTRRVMTYPASIVTCHYAFQRLPVSPYNIEKSIPDESDLEVDEKIATKVVLFYLGDFVKDPIEFITSKTKIVQDPIEKLYTQYYINFKESMNLPYSNSEIHNYYKDIDKILKSFQSESLYIEIVKNMFVTYDNFLASIQRNANEFSNLEVEFNRNQYKADSSGIWYLNTGKGNSETFKGASRSDNSKTPQNQNMFEQPQKFQKSNNEKFYDFWGYQPNSYNRDLGFGGSNDEDIFKTMAILLYGSSKFSTLIKSTYNSIIALIIEICRLRQEILAKYSEDMADIEVNGVDSEITSFSFSQCNTNESSNLKTPNKDFDDVNVFNVLQIIYKIPILVYDLYDKLDTIQSAEINNNLYKQYNFQTLCLALRIARNRSLVNQKIISYRPLIQKVTIDQYDELKSGTGPIPLDMILLNIRSIRKPNEYGKRPLNRPKTTFDAAIELYELNQVSRSNKEDTSKNFMEISKETRGVQRNYQEPKFKDSNNLNERYKESSKYSNLKDQVLKPLLRRTLLSVPGEVEGRRTLEFIKITTALMDLLRKPVASFPDKEVERDIVKIFTGQIVDNESKELLFSKYGMNFDEISSNFEYLSVSEEENIATQCKYSVIHDKRGNIVIPSNIAVNINSLKFIAEYLKEVVKVPVSLSYLSSTIGCFFESESIKALTKTYWYDQVKEAIQRITMSIFGNIYIYWNNFKFNLQSKAINFMHTCKLKLNDKSSIIKHKILEK